MFAGILAGITWALESIFITRATDSFVYQIIVVLACTFIHDAISAILAGAYNGVRGNLKNVWKALKTRSGKFVVLAAIIGGPIGMTGYVLTLSNMGASIGAIASAVFPAIGAVLAYFFLKEKMQWYRWLFLLLTIGGVYGLFYSPEIVIENFLLGLLGTLMCSFGWGIEAVILAKCLKDGEVTDEIALQIRQTTSALTFGIVVLPIFGGWGFTASIFTGSSGSSLGGWLIPTIALAALFATVSYLFYYKAISQIGASKSMALNVSYAAWAIVFNAIIFAQTQALNVITIICALVVLVFSILTAADYKDLFKKRE